MTPVSGPHLTPDDFDAWLAGALASAGEDHLSQCLVCRERADTEREIVELLGALPLMSPTPGFSDRVMARVVVPQPLAGPALATLRHRIFATRRSMALAASMLVLVAGSMTGSVVWTLSHQDTLAALGSWLTAQAGQAAWLGVRGIASNFMEQPWFAGFKALATSPGRLGVASALALTAYLGGVLALRRLLALPARQVAHASA
jgi:hypothetical protein